jgi:carbon storage regulator
MLVMRRRPGESFTIGEGIAIEILEVSGSRVKLGISAPDSFAILRNEIRLTRDENLSASKSIDPALISSLVHQLHS